jgi:hypothetical protein
VAIPSFNVDLNSQSFNPESLKKSEEVYLDTATDFLNNSESSLHEGWKL